jgi:integrase
LRASRSIECTITVSPSRTNASSSSSFGRAVSLPDALSVKVRSTSTPSLDPPTVAYLRRRLAMLDEERRAFGQSYHDQGKLFSHPDGKPIHPDTITRRFNRLVDRAGLPRIRLHDVRHTYATLSLDAGVEPKVVSDRIGHANMAYTLTIYTHRSTGRDRLAAEKIAGLIFGEQWRDPAG